MRYFDLSHFAILKVSGEDAHTFIKAQFTCDPEELSRRDWLFTAWCLPNGRAIATFILFKKNRDYYLMLPAMLRDKFTRRLEMFVLRSAVNIVDCSDDITLLGVAGEKASSLVAGIREDESITVLELWDHQDRYILCCPNDKVSDVMHQIHGLCEEGDRNSWSLLDIEAGIPWIINATSEMYLPQMLNMDRFDGLSYKKGCYPGQEVIARLHYRGQLKKRLYLGKAESSITPGPGDRIETRDRTYAGDVIDAERYPGGGVRLLAVADLEHAEAGPLYIRGNDTIPVKLSSINYPRQ